VAGMHAADSGLRVANHARRTEIVIGLTILIGILGTLVGLEAVLRAQASAQFGDAQGAFEASALYSRDPATGLLRLNPGARSGTISVNRYGFRGLEIAGQSGGRIVQLAFIGHSTTLDPYSGETENWPYLVSRGVGVDVPDCRVELINGGVPGYGTAAMIRYFDAYVRPHKPVLTFLLSADYNNNFNRQAKAQGLAIYADRSHGWLADHSLLIAKVVKNSKAVALMRSAYSKIGKLVPDWINLEMEFDRTVTNAVEHIASSGSRIAVLTTAYRLRREQSQPEQIAAVQTQLEFTPYLSIPDLLEAQARYNRVVETAVRKSDAILIGDENSVPGTTQYYADSNHFTPAGSRAMAERVMRQLHGSRAYRDMTDELERRCQE
jgi:lysophospholipase L1-like esterase